MSVVEYRKQARTTEDLLDEINQYDTPWAENISENDLTEDEDFIYLEIEQGEDIAQAFHDLGAELSAHTAEVNGGDKYVLSAEK